MNENNTIKSWLEDDRPREKMMQKGPAALSDTELLTILIASGTREKTAFDLARDILALAQNNLRELGRLGIKELQKIKGIGEARAITICAAMELGRRRQLAEGLDTPFVKNSRVAAEIFMPLLQDKSYECFCVLYMNHASKVIRTEMVSNGGLTATVADIRVILKNALLYSASTIMVAHNHPSGNRNPSDADVQLTLRLREAAALMDIRLLDHIIIAGHDYLSMCDEGIM